MGRFAKKILARLKKSHHFPCPLCGVQCEAHEKSEFTTLHHPLPWCEGLRKGDLLSAYTIAVKPELKYPPLEIPKEWQ